MKKLISSMLAISLLLILITSACKRELNLTPISSLSDASYWKTSDHFDAFVTGVHNSFRGHNQNFMYLGELRSDIYGIEPGAGATFSGESTQGVERMWDHTLDLNNSGVPNFGTFYNNINQLNLLIYKLNSTNVVTAANKEYYLGLAYGMRAYYYFHLYRSWGKVVLQTAPTTEIEISNLSKAPSSEADVMKQIKSDIDSSKIGYGANYTFRSGKAIWSKAATLMLQAEVYLWTSYRGGGTADATVAKNGLTDISTNVPALTLLPSYADVFSTKGNNEIILASRYLLNEATMLFIPQSFTPQTGLIVNFHDSIANRQFNVSTDNWGGLLRAPIKVSTFRQYNPNDTRRLVTVQPVYRKVGNNYTIVGAFAKKYSGEQSAGSRQYTNDYPIYRYSDLLLLLAEAKVALGESPAIEINRVRARAFGVSYNAAAQGYPNQPGDLNPKEAILQERLLEFILEGKRWYDLRRMGDNFVFAKTSLPTSQAFRLLWPIDVTSLTNNRLLEQTPGYPKF